MTLRHPLSLATLSLSLTGLSLLIPSQAEAITFSDGGEFSGFIEALEVDTQVTDSSEFRFADGDGNYQDIGDYGEFGIGTADGVFAPYEDEVGLIQSVDFDDVDEGVSGFLEFESDDSALSPWSFDITDNVVMTPIADDSLRVSADGVFRGPEDEAPGNFTLTTQGDGQTTASFSSDVAVPEPTGLLGLGVVAGVMAGLRRWTKPEESG